MGGAFSFYPLLLENPVKVFVHHKVLFLNQKKPETFFFYGLKLYWIILQMPGRLVTLKAAYQKVHCCLFYRIWKSR